MEVEDQLAAGDEDLRPWIIYRCPVGSRASRWSQGPLGARCRLCLTPWRGAA